MLQLHIAAALVSLLAGFIALYSGKGSPLHRSSGKVFTGAMLLMAGSGALVALLLRPNRLNAIVGTLTCYLVATGFLAVRRSVQESRPLLVALMASALASGLAALVLGRMAVASADGRVDHFPAAIVFAFAFLALAAALGDARMLQRGSIGGTQRLTRHVWRMGLALLLASLSLFRLTRHLPAALHIRALDNLPALLVLSTLVFWLVRLRLRQRRMPAPAAARGRSAASLPIQGANR